MNQGSSVEVLTVQVSQSHLPPRSFLIPTRWVTLSAFIFWICVLVGLGAGTYALRIHWLNLNASPEKMQELEDEVQALKIALEKGAIGLPTATNQGAGTGDSKDRNESETPSEVAPGSIPLSQKPGFWTGLAEGVTVPPESYQPLISAENPRMNWKGKFVEFVLDVTFKNPGQGNQQGHIVVLARGTDRIYAHPSSVLNIDSRKSIVDVDRGEFFSVSRFRVLKALIGPFESRSDLREIQVYFFDLNKNLILTRTFGNNL